MRSLRILVSTFPVVFLISVASAQSQPGPSFILRLPQEASPETAIVNYQVMGSGGFASFIRPQKNTWEYPLPLSRSSFVNAPPEGMKLLIYLPGYRMITAEFNKEQLSKPQTFAPSLEKLWTARFEGRLVNSRYEPLGAQKLFVCYFLTEAMGYFGYFDGSVPEIPVAAFQTNRDGTFATPIPAFSADPFFKEGFFRIAGEGDDNRGSCLHDTSLSPSQFQASETGKQFQIVRTSPATISGRIGNEFWARMNLTSDVQLLPAPGYVDRLNVYIAAEDIDATRGYSDLLRGDGTFELRVPPGRYDVKLRICDKTSVSNCDKTIMVQENTVVLEGQRENLQLP
jgi:hypothetical protein